MSKLSNVLVTVGAIVGVVVVAMVLSRRPKKGPESDVQVSASEPIPAATVGTNRSSFFTKGVRRHPSQSPTDDGSMEASSTTTNLTPNWEEKVDDI